MQFTTLSIAITATASEDEGTTLLLMRAAS
jgi:hypothetical protein